MGQMTNGKGKKEAKKEEVKKEEEIEDEEEEIQEQDGISVHTPCKIPTSSQSQEDLEVELELQLLLSFATYPLRKLKGPHRHFVLYGIMEYMRSSFNRPFTAQEVLDLVGRFYNMDVLEPDSDDLEFLTQEEDFRLPQSYFNKDDS
ncbi:hypothetical protein ACJIZ3_020004 [Penstemon smallii]|uniref:Uncharacterized protein n=1 Tax=Penstemon smallii TaxID=265156 RepID=A0ABD3SHZ6_9LAMI